ncbi:MAG: acylneuraminate cytidylyltransferase family protein [Lachnospiraceae bacterium]|nr:acylneuraminate cytidylyltransferase family protein [Lachnospiraceae bacterium]
MVNVAEGKGNIAIIPARSGSKGLPDKNIKPLNGIPLISYSIKTAIDSKCFEKVFVSTDSQKYADISMEYGADASFLRSERTSSDSAGSWDVVREVLSEFEKRGHSYERIMLMQPTSPLRTAEDVINSFNLMEEKGACSIVGVTETDHSPIWCNTLPEDLSMESFRNEKYADMPRQALPKFYRVNGAIYLIKRSELDTDRMLKIKSYAYIMPRERSVDIDTELDFVIAEELMKKTGKA